MNRMLIAGVWFVQGYVLSELGLFEQAIEYTQKSLIFWQGEEEEFLIGEHFSLNLIGWCLMHLSHYSEAILKFQEALIIARKTEDVVLSRDVAGHISTNHLLLNQDDTAWSIWQTETKRSPEAFKQWGDAIHHLEKSSNPAAAFALANRILHRLPQEVSAEEIPPLLTVFFADLIEMKISETLLRDIAEEAMRLFPEPAQRVSAEAALHMAGYITAQRTGQGELYLENLHPDMAIAVRAVAREAKLE